MELQLSMPLVRHFLRSSNCKDGYDVLKKACVDAEPAAIQLLLVCTKIRANRRTRRSYEQVQAALSGPTKPRWLSRLAKGLFSVYKALEKLLNRILIKYLQCFTIFTLICERQSRMQWQAPGGSLLPVGHTIPTIRGIVLTNNKRFLGSWSGLPHLECSSHFTFSAFF